MDFPTSQLWDGTVHCDCCATQRWPCASICRPVGPGAGPNPPAPNLARACIKLLAHFPSSPAPQLQPPCIFFRCRLCSQEGQVFPRRDHPLPPFSKHSQAFLFRYLPALLLRTLRRHTVTCICISPGCFFLFVLPLLNCFICSATGRLGLVVKGLAARNTGVRYGVVWCAEYRIGAGAICHLSCLSAISPSPRSMSMSD